jgi:hypothetical protein
MFKYFIKAFVVLTFIFISTSLLYIEKEQKQLVPTELGKIVNKLLCENFADVINVEFTAIDAETPDFANVYSVDRTASGCISTPS